jgi:hypothetical protein
LRCPTRRLAPPEGEFALQLDASADEVAAMSAEAQTVTENRFCTLYRATPTSMQMTLPGFVASRAHRHTFSDPCSTMPVTAAFREVRAQSQ